MGIYSVNLPYFTKTNMILKAILVKLKKDSMSTSDLETLYGSFDVETPAGLQTKYL
jgi:hypothetical protein